MSSTGRRVVLTGIGVITPLGQDAASFWDGLAHGKSGIRTIQSFDPSPLDVRFAGEIAGFEPKKYLSKDGRKQTEGDGPRHPTRGRCRPAGRG